MQDSLIALRDEIDAALALIARLDRAGLLGATAAPETAPAPEPPQEPQERVELPARPLPAPAEAPSSAERERRHSAAPNGGATPLPICARPGCGQTFAPLGRKVYCGDACRTAIQTERRTQRRRAEAQNGIAEPDPAEPPPAPALEARAERVERVERPLRGPPVPDAGDAAALRPPSLGEWDT